MQAVLRASLLVTFRLSHRQRSAKVPMGLVEIDVIQNVAEEV